MKYLTDEESKEQRPKTSRQLAKQYGLKYMGSFAGQTKRELFKINDNGIGIAFVVNGYRDKYVEKKRERGVTYDDSYYGEIWNGKSGHALSGKRFQTKEEVINWAIENKDIWGDCHNRTAFEEKK